MIIETRKTDAYCFGNPDMVRTPRRRRRHAEQADTAAEQAQGERD